MTQSKVRNLAEIHTLSEQFSFNVWLIREGRGRGNKGPVPLASIWDKPERLAMLQSFLWHLLRLLSQLHHLLPLHNLASLIPFGAVAEHILQYFLQIFQINISDLQVRVYFRKT